MNDAVLAPVHMRDTGDRVHEWARWSAWSGSLEMVAHIVRTTEEALAHPRYVTLDHDSTEPLASVTPTGALLNGSGPFTRLTVLTRRDAETFESPDALLHSLTPEACMNFDRIEISVSVDQIFAHITFARKPDHPAGVVLSVWAFDPERGDDVIAAAWLIASCIERGFRREVGSVSGSQNLNRCYRGKTMLTARLVMVGAPWIMGFSVGLTLFVCMGVLIPDRHLPEAVYLAIVLLIAGTYGLAWNYWVPPVEIALEGRTRLRSLLTRTFQAAVVLILTTVAKAVIQSG